MRWLVYNEDGDQVGRTRHAEDAAVLVSVQAEGATIRVRGVGIVWTEGPAADGWAAEAYDQCADVCERRAVK